MSTLGLRDIPLEKREDEALGLGDYADSLSEFILQCETPLTIALQGDWGSGKTSLMNLIKLRAEQEKAVQTIWFNTWQYSQFEMQGELSVSLLSHFVDALGVEDSKMAKYAIAGLTKIGKWGLSQIADMVAGDTAKEAVEKVLEKVTSGEMDPAKQISKLKREIEKVVAKKIEKIGQPGARIIVFVDDLDRLLPERAVELLEVFKLFLDVPGCVYVLACDYQVIAQGLKRKFGVGSEDLKGKSFFDKIIQLPFSMPLGQYDVVNYIKKLLTRIGVTYTEDDISLYADMINYSVGFNPRGMKRIFNSLLLLNLVAQKKSLFDTKPDIAIKTEKQRIIFGVLCLQMAYEAAYAYLQKNDDLLRHDYLDGFKHEEKLENSPEYAGLREELNREKGNSDLRRLSQFMEIFFNALQLRSDENNGTLSDKEIENLREILSFSALTSKEASQKTQGGFSDDRYRNRDMAKQFIEELSEKYEDILKRNGWSLNTYQQRNVDKVAIYFNPLREGSKTMQVGFDFDKSMIMASLGGGTKANHDFIRQWIEASGKSVFPDIQYMEKAWHTASFWQLHASSEMSRDDMVDLFKQKTIETLDKLLPLLAKKN